MKRKTIQTQVDELISKMTLEEKVSQMLHDAPALPHLGIPKYNWWSEAPHGMAREGLPTVFPQAIARAATFDPALEREIGDAVSTEARAKYNLFVKKGLRNVYTGLTLWSPNINMFRDPRWGRGQETFGEDPHLTSVMGCAYVKGLQGTDKRFLKTSACAKHYAVHSGPEAERHGFNVDVSRRALREYYLPAFEALVKEAKVESVMSAYNSVNGAPCSANVPLLDEILRKEWGFGGHVVSDCGALDDILTGHKAANSAVDAVALALEAGCDLCCSAFYSHLVEAVRKGRVKEALVDRALRRLFTTRMKLGILGDHDPTPWDGLGAEAVCTPRHRALALRCAEESLVLVKNDGILPLSREKTDRLGVYGALAMDERALLGNYNGLTDAPVTPLSGILRAAGPAVQVAQDRRSKLLGDETLPEWNIGETYAAAHGDPATMPLVFCVGLVPMLEGEEGETIPPFVGDRRTIAVPECQLEMMTALKKEGFPIIAVVFGGSPQDLSRLEEICSAVLLAWYPGEAGGFAIGEALFGDINPSGRLPVSFPKSLDGLPPFRDYGLPGHTYRYSDAEMLHPFGYGLSYTTFRYSNMRVERAGKRIAVSADVTNVGKRAGGEVVQLYVRAPAGTKNAAKHHLEGFKRIVLAPGATRRVEFKLTEKAFFVYSDDGSASVPKGSSTVFVGGGQPGFSKTVGRAVRF